jgi:hypothetical protein
VQKFGVAGCADIADRLLIMANVTSLEQSMSFLFAPFATSSFLAHSLISTVSVVQGVVNCTFPFLIQAGNQV